jgi:hypothetical protein
MHPRTMAIVVAGFLLAAIGGRFAVVQFGLLPISEEVVLKKAVALTVNYHVDGKFKTYRISGPSEVREVLAALRVQREDYYRYNSWGGGWRPQVSFHFPNGSRRDQSFEGPNQLGGFMVDRAFCEKLNDIVSRHEGRKIDIFEFPPNGFQGGPGWNPMWGK